MADVLDRTIEVPDLPHAAATGAAIHAAVAAGLFDDYGAAARRYGARSFRTFAPDRQAAQTYHDVFQRYRALSENPLLRQTMRSLRR
jgi:L-ribulokinase